MVSSSSFSPGTIMRTSAAFDAIEGLDTAFLRRTLRTTLILGLVLSLWLVQTLAMPVLGGFAAGVLVSVAGLAATMKVAEVSARRSRSWIPAAAAVAKAVMLYLGLRVLVWQWGFSPLALAAGASLVVVVIVLKVVGRLNAAPEARRIQEA